MELLEKYEEKIVVGSYHRFKTNDNLFYYRTSLLEALDKCEDELLEALILDYMDAERVDRAEGSLRIKDLINKIRIDIEEMQAIMRTIDDRHLLYRTRAVQRAQFLLLSDGSIKSKINNLLHYYANGIRSKLVYKELNRESVPKLCSKLAETLSFFENSESILLNRVVSSFKNKALKNEKLPYDIKYNNQRLKSILTVLRELLRLKKETYIRNFSTVLFRDSKVFQRDFLSCIQSILYDFSDSIVEKSRILEAYNLYENPTYLLIKGDISISFERSVINVYELEDGIALSNASLEKIKSIKVYTNRLITVENLTTFHDMPYTEGVIVYLGGYHNNSKQKLLCQIYKENPNIQYLHTGDIDVFVFFILENLKTKTAIPFKPLKMDLATLDSLYRNGFVKDLTAQDVKLIKENIESELSAYSEVLNYMLMKNCKAEQESLTALDILSI